MRNSEHMIKFGDVYRVHLRDTMAKYPDDYGITGPNDPPRMITSKMRETAHLYADVCEQTASAMIASFQRGDYNHDGRAIKATCKALGIKHTRTAIEAYFNGAEG